MALRIAAGGGLILALAAGPACAGADSGGRAFCADRPGKATPACILDVGRLQLETGLADAALDRSHGARDDAYLFGQTELRLGVSPRTEFEAAWTPLSLTRATGSPHRSGVGDLALGFRTALTRPNTDGTGAALQGFVTVPTATHGQGAGGWEGGVRLPVSASLAHGFDLGLTPELDVRRDGGGGGTHVAFSGAGALSHDVGPISLTAELWAERDEDPGRHVTQATFDVSAAWMARPDLQLDAGAYAGLNRSTPDVELYVGLARRF